MRQQRKGGICVMKVRSISARVEEVRWVRGEMSRNDSYMYDAKKQFKRNGRSRKRKESISVPEVSKNVSQLKEDSGLTISIQHTQRTTPAPTPHILTPNQSPNSEPSIRGRMTLCAGLSGCMGVVVRNLYVVYMQEKLVTTRDANK